MRIKKYATRTKGLLYSLTKKRHSAVPPWFLSTYIIDIDRHFSCTPLRDIQYPMVTEEAGLRYNHTWFSHNHLAWSIDTARVRSPFSPWDLLSCTLAISIYSKLLTMLKLLMNTISISYHSIFVKSKKATPSTG